MTDFKESLSHVLSELSKAEGQLSARALKKEERTLVSSPAQTGDPFLSFPFLLLLPPSPL